MSTWGRAEDRLLLLELVATGACGARRSQQDALQHLSELRWIRRARRSGLWTLEPATAGQIEALLDREWPQWRSVLQRLTEAGLPPTPTGLTQLRDRERLDRLQSRPAFLHGKTFAALTGAHSKVGPAVRRAAQETTTLTGDQVVRLRPVPGMTVRHQEACLDAWATAQINGGEVILTQRALLAGACLDGDVPRAILLVENLGAYLDMAAPQDVLLIHVPGWDSSLVRLLLPNPPPAPLLHFGDLDPAGARIVRHLMEAFPSLVWWVPSFAAEYFDAHAQSGEWGELDARIELPSAVQVLRAAGRWLEQEVLVLDPRLPGELQIILHAQRRTGTGPWLGAGTARPTSR